MSAIKRIRQNRNSPTYIFSSDDRKWSQKLLAWMTVNMTAYRHLFTDFHESLKCEILMQKEMQTCLYQESSHLHAKI